MLIKRPKFAGKAAIAAFMAFCSLTYAQASTAFLRGSPPAGESWSVETYSGPVDGAVSTQRPAATVTVLVLVETLSAEEKEQVKNELSEFFVEFHTRPLRIGFVGVNGELSDPVPVMSRTRLKQLLDKNISADEPELEPSASILDELLAVISKLGPKNSSVLIVGEFPTLNSATTMFASALIVRAFTAQHLQASLYSPASVGQEWFPLFASLAGETVTELHKLSLPSASETVTQFDWATAPPTAGFTLSSSKVIDEERTTVVEVPDLSVADGVPIPSVQEYSDAQKGLDEAKALLVEEPLTQARADRIRQYIETALRLNARDPEALKTATSLYEKAADYRAAASMSGLLVEVRPLDGSAYAAFGHALRLNSDLDRAETTLNRAVQLGITTPQVNEDFARLRIARKDEQGALPYLQEVLRADAKRQDIWFVQGEVAEHLQNTDLAEHSYEEGLSLGGVHVAQAGALLRLYLKAKQTDQALAFAKRQLAALPEETEPRLEFATTLDELKQSSLAMEAWRGVLKVQPNSERGHTRLARLLLERGDAGEAEKEAIAGLSAVSNSASLCSVKAEAEESLGRRYDARRTLQEGVAVSNETSLATQFAAMEEQFMGGAPAAYARLAELTAPSSPEYLHALEHGFDTSLRDGDIRQAEKFASLLEASGLKEDRSLLGSERSNANLTVVPGGLSALAFAAHASKQELPPESFLLAYSRTLLANGVDAGKNAYSEGIREYFAQIGALRAMGMRNPIGIAIDLSLTNKETRRQTEKALNILGIQLKSGKGAVELAQGEKKAQAVRQETAAALAVDEVGIQEALQAGKSYRLVIPDEAASIYPSERIWQDALGLKSYGPGGFAEELVRVPHMARLYAALNSMDRAAADELLKTMPLRELMEHESDLLYYFAPALALEGGHVAVPGGPKAELIWTSLVGASPATPGAFFPALLKRDDGRWFVFFALLAQVDRAHQAFFTASEGRTKHFYDLWTSASQPSRPYEGIVDSGFQQMMRSVPLDDDGHVEFPGSPEVWTVAQGRSSDEAHIAHLMKKVQRAAAPDQEDIILTRLAGKKYKENSAPVSELQNFLAVSSIDAHRLQPMDEESALLLAQRYGDYAAIFPYLTDLRTLGANDYRQFFAAFDRIIGHSPIDANLQLGQLHALTEWICLLVQRHVITDDAAAELLRKLSASFAAAGDAASYTFASLESMRAILRACNAGALPSPDQAVQSCLLGKHASREDPRAKDFAKVMDSQRVPSLSTLMLLFDATGNTFGTSAAFASLEAIEKDLDSLPVVDLPKGTKVTGKEKNALARYDLAPARKVVSEMKEKAAKRKANVNDLQKLSRQLLAELQPQVAVAVAGPLYAYFLRSSDVIVMEDQLLLRKHHYFEFESDSLSHQRMPPSDFIVSSEEAGSYFSGGFAQFPYAAGLAAAHSKGPGRAPEALAAQLATIRGAELDRLNESDQRLVALRIIVAREWIYESARNPEVLRALREETVGLLSLSRRAELLNHLSFREWNRVWDSITLSELLVLGGRYIKRFPADPWPSHATAALRAADNNHDDWKLNTLGPIPVHLFGCNHAHLLSNAPYEEYERHFPAEMAERTAEFKLFLVFQGDRLGLQPEALEQMAETLAVQAVHKAQMTDYRDWRSLLSAYGSIDTADLARVIAK